jgi:hypothetical protein
MKFKVTRDGVQVTCTGDSKKTLLADLAEATSFVSGSMDVNCIKPKPKPRKKKKKATTPLVPRHVGGKVDVTEPQSFPSSVDKL